MVFLLLKCAGAVLKGENSWDQASGIFSLPLHNAVGWPTIMTFTALFQFGNLIHQWQEGSPSECEDKSKPSRRNRSWPTHAKDVVTSRERLVFACSCLTRYIPFVLVCFWFCSLLQKNQFTTVQKTETKITTSQNCVEGLMNDPTFDQ